MTKLYPIIWAVYFSTSSGVFKILTPPFNPLLRVPKKFGRYDVGYERKGRRKKFIWLKNLSFNIRVTFWVYIFTFSSTTGVYLCLKDETTRWVERDRNLFCFGWCKCNITLLDSNVKFSHNILALIFMEIEEFLRFMSKSVKVSEIEDLG